MAVSFGSVGDIIAVCQVVYNVVKALSDTQGSAPKYQDLVSELDTLANTLKQIQTLSGSLEKKVDVSRINSEIQRCMVTLENIQRKIIKYKQSLSTKEGSGNALRDAYKKLRFQNHKERVADQIAEAVAQRHIDKSANGKPSGATGTAKGVLISGYVRPALQKVESISSNIPRGAIRAIPIMQSFEKAAEECKRRCSELALRCSYDNIFYRDTEFEIDVDLVENKRNCLENLLEDAQTTSEDWLSPKAVHRIRDIFSDPVFFKNLSLSAEVKWNHVESTWWQAGIATASNASVLIDLLCIVRDETAGIYGFLFHRDGEWIPVIVDDNIYLTKGDWDELPREDRESAMMIDLRAYNNTSMEESYRQLCQTGSRSLYFGACVDQNETWLPLLEKAFAKAHGDYSALSWGNPGYYSTEKEALEDLSGGVSSQVHVRDIIDRDRFWREQLKDANNDFLFTVRTKPYADFVVGHGFDGTIYAPSGTPIMRTYEGFGLRLLLLRSLQVTDESEWKGSWSNASQEWTPQWMRRLNHNFADQQLFWIGYKDLMRKYTYIYRTRKFDSSWTIAQQWVTVEVQRDDDYQDTSFNFTLQKEGTVVVCLGQLDSRYYRGLEGIYRFQLHFHVYADKDTELLVASRGNYLGSRSVSAEVNLEPGKYKVRLQISATKLDSAQSVTDVIAQNSRGRRTKLLQAGAQYDIAHAKALGWRQLRAKQARIERQAADRRRRASSAKKAKRAVKTKSADGSEDHQSSDDTTDSEDEDVDKDWNAICAIGLKVFSRDPELQLDVKLSPELEHLLDEDESPNTAAHGLGGK
ncbi:MAG: hypothetical protein Q9221_009079 [Calogaya cf. arnoldii]